MDRHRHTFIHTYTSTQPYNTHNELYRIRTVDMKQQFVATVWFSFFFLSFFITQTKASEAAAEARRARWFGKEPGAWKTPLKWGLIPIPSRQRAPAQLLRCQQDTQQSPPDPRGDEQCFGESAASVRCLARPASVVSSTRCTPLHG